MSSGFNVPGHGDLDGIFGPYDAGTKPAATGFRVGSQDLRDRFNPRSEGDDCGFNTGFRRGGTDLRQLFAARGTSTQALVIPFGQQYMAVSTFSHDAGASFALTLSPNGTWAISLGATQGGSISGSPTSGTWHKHPASGVGSGYEVRFTANISVTQHGSFESGTYTASTGWLSLGAAREVTARTGHISAGGSQHTGMSQLRGDWLVEIRKQGSTGVRSATCRIDIEAQAS
jgi:hypothetical protein